MAISKLGKVKISEIELSKKNNNNRIFHNLRQTFNATSMTSMKESIAEIGLESPLLVRAVVDNPDPSFNQTGFPKGKKFELIAGERRLRGIFKLIEENREVLDTRTGKKNSAKKVFEEIDAKILYNCDDKTALRLSVAENLEREEVSQIDLMNFCIELSERRNENGELVFTPAEISEIIGRSPTWISQTKSLIRLPKEVQNMLQRGTIDRSTALYFLKVKPDKIPSIVKEAEKIARESQQLEKEKADRLYEESVKDNEIAAGKIALAEAGVGDIKQAKKERTLTKQKLKESKKRREAANEKTPRLSQDHLQEGAKNVGAIKRKHNPIGVKTIRQKRDVLVKILAEIEGQKVTDPETGKTYNREDVEFVKTVCDHFLGKKGKFEPFSIIEEIRN